MIELRWRKTGTDRVLEYRGCHAIDNRGVPVRISPWSEWKPVDEVDEDDEVEMESEGR